MLTGIVVTFQRLMWQWQRFGKSSQEVFFHVVTEEVGKKTEKSGHRVRHEKETAYEVSSTELEEYGESLLVALKKLEGAFASWEEDPTEEDIGDEQPTRISG